jgi:ABC-2 type transport system permease protein
MRKIFPFLKKEFIEIIRDRLSLISILFLPSILLFLYGYAISLDVKDIRITLCDLDRSSFSRDFVDSLTSSGYFRVVSYRDSPEEIDSDIRQSKANLGIVIYPDAYTNLLKHRNSSIQILIDGSNAQSTQNSLGYLFLAIYRFNSQLTKDIATANNITLPSIEMNERILYNPLLKSPLYLIPGLIAFVIMIVGAIASTISIVREKENRTVEQLALTPISPVLLITGKIIPYFLISLVSSTIMIILSMLLFELPLNGSILNLAIALITFLLCAIGFGVFISTIAESQQVAFTIAAFTTLLPTIVLSGFVFPIQSMPDIIQVFTYIVPARYFIAILRSILLKGSGLSDLIYEYISLIFYALAIISISIIRVKKKGLMG